MSDFDFQPYRDFILCGRDIRRAWYASEAALLPLPVGMVAQRELETTPVEATKVAWEKAPSSKPSLPTINSAKLPIREFSHATTNDFDKLYAITN